MKKTRRTTLICHLLAAALTFTIGATTMAEPTVTVPKIFSDNMVLQRGMPIPVWGQATPKATVTVTFKGQSKAAVAGEDGKWQLHLDPIEADNSPAALVIRAKDDPDPLTLANVVVGEVWLFSGQSNAAFAVRSSDSADAATAAADLPGIRFFGPAGWTVSSPETAPNYSAFAFYFARALHRDEKVPVGMLVFARGGTMIQSWTTREGLAGHPTLKRDILDAWEHDTTPARMAETVGQQKWAAMLNQAGGDPEAAVDKILNRAASQPGINIENSGMLEAAPFALRGFGWYQGESNAWGFHAAQRYEEELHLLIRDWRRLWRGKATGRCCTGWASTPDTTRTCRRS